MEQERDYQTVFFKDLFFTALYKWKIALAVAFVFAIVFSGYAIYSNRTASVQSPSVDSGNSQIAAQLQASIADTENAISKHLDYLENSLLMNIDPYQTCIAGFYMAVTPSSLVNAPADVNVVDNTNVIFRAYRSYLTSNENLEALALQFGTEAQYIGELISLDASTAGMLGISVRSSTMEDALTIAQAVQSALEERKPQIESLVEEHSAAYIPFSYGPKLDSSLNDTQNSAIQKLTTLRNNITNAKKELNNLPAPSAHSVASPAKYAIFGIILGVSLVVCCAWLHHLCSGKVYSQRVLQNITGVKVLGCQPVCNKKFIIDRWLNKLEGRHVDQNQISVIAAAIKNLCDDNAELLIVGSSKDEERQLVIKALTNAGIRCNDAGNLFGSTMGFDAMPGCTAVLLVESCGISTYNAVQRTIGHITDQNKPLLGCILING